MFFFQQLFEEEILWPGAQDKSFGTAGRGVHAWGQSLTRTPSCSTAWHGGARLSAASRWPLAFPEDRVCCVLCILDVLSIGVCLLAVGSSLKFQFSIGSLPGGAHFLADTRASETHKQHAQTQSNLLDAVNRIHGEAHLEANDQWNTEGFTCTHGCVSMHWRLASRLECRTAWIQQIQLRSTRLYVEEIRAHKTISGLFWWMWSPICTQKASNKRQISEGMAWTHGPVTKYRLSVTSMSMYESAFNTNFRSNLESFLR